MFTFLKIFLVLKKLKLSSQTFFFFANCLLFNVIARNQYTKFNNKQSLKCLQFNFQKHI